MSHEVVRPLTGKRLKRKRTATEWCSSTHKPLSLTVCVCEHSFFCGCYDFVGTLFLSFLFPSSAACPTLRMKKKRKKERCVTTRKSFLFSFFPIPGSKGWAKLTDQQSVREWEKEKRRVTYKSGLITQKIDPWSQGHLLWLKAWVLFLFSLCWGRWTVSSFSLSLLFEMSTVHKVEKKKKCDQVFH